MNYGIEWWLKNQMTGNPGIVERYAITETDRGLQIDRMNKALNDYREQNDRDWKKWREWHAIIKQQKEARA